MLIKPIKIKNRFICAGLLLSVQLTFAQKQGLQAIDSMKKNLHTFTNADTLKVKTIFRIADGYIQINPDSAMVYMQQGLALSKKLDFKKGIAGFYNALGMYYSDKADYKKALSYYQPALTLNQQIGNKINEASTLSNIGSLYQRTGDFDQSQEYSFRALKIAEQISATKLIALLNNNIGTVYSSEKDFNRALLYHFKALKSYQQLGLKQGIAQASNSIANEYHELKNLDDAAIYYQKSLDLYRDIDNRIGQATVLSQMGLLDIDLDKRLEYLFKAKQLFDDTDPQYIVAVTNIGNIGSIYGDIYIGAIKLEPGRKYRFIPADKKAIEQNAETYLNIAVKYSAGNGDADNLATFTAHLGILQQKAGNYRAALDNFQLSQKINDSVYSQESKNKIAELTAQYNFQKKEDTYKQQQQISTLKMRQIYLYAALAIALISGILIILLNRSRIVQLRLKNELQKREAEEQTRELLHRNKLSESELKAIRAQMNPHFIFNVLNSIESYIMENDPKMAARLVQKFASLSRIILENSTQSMVVAEREWKALQLYTELEAIRFNNHFGYSFYADSQIDLNTLLLPPMLVQPLIENSIHHGLRSSPDDDKKVNVSLEQTEHELVFIVEDNGVGLNANNKTKTSAVKNKSIGLAAIRERVDIINSVNENTAAEFDIRPKTSAEGKGTVARLTLPKVFVLRH